MRNHIIGALLTPKREHVPSLDASGADDVGYLDRERVAQMSRRYGAIARARWKLRAPGACEPHIG